MKERPKHPSGKPQREQRTKGLPIWRIPDDGFVTPRLRQQGFTQAVGFTCKLVSDIWDNDE